MSEVPLYLNTLSNLDLMASAPEALCRGTWLIRNSAHLEPYSRTIPRTLWWS